MRESAHVGGSVPRAPRKVKGNAVMAKRAELLKIGYVGRTSRTLRCSRDGLGGSSYKKQLENLSRTLYGASSKPYRRILRSSVDGSMPSIVAVRLLFQLVRLSVVRVSSVPKAPLAMPSSRR